MDIDQGTVPIPLYPLAPADLVGEGLSWLTTQHFKLRCDELLARHRPDTQPREFTAADYLRLLAVDRAIVRSVEKEERPDIYRARAAGASWWALARVTEELHYLDVRNDYVLWLDDQCRLWDETLAAGASITEGLAPHDRVAAYALAEIRTFSTVMPGADADPLPFTFGPRPPGVPIGMYFTKATTECDECGQGPAPHCSECGACLEIFCDCDDETGRGDSPAPTGGPDPDDDRADALELRAGDELPATFDDGVLTGIGVQQRDDEPTTSLDQRCGPDGCECYKVPAIHLGMPVRVPNAALRHAVEWWPKPAPEDMPVVVLTPAVPALLLSEVAAL